MKNYEKRSLALLGHGKWKSALGHTLLIIGMVLVSLGAYAQTPGDIPNGLVMSKKWVPSNNENTRGKVVLETYVTGSSITSITSIPNDIVLVVDQSGSMAHTMSGSTTRLQALKNSVTTFCDMVLEDAKTNKVDHKIAIVGFASGYTGYQNYSYWDGYYDQRWNWTNTELLSTQNVVAYGTATSGACAITTQNYQDALVAVNNEGYLNNRLSTAITRIAAEGGTCMQYGLEMAYGVLRNRTVTTYQAPDGTTHPRGQIVIFFTDGYPGLYHPTANNYNAGENQDGRFAQGYGNNDYIDMRGATPRYVNYNDLWSAANIADAAVTQANNLKNNGATVYTIGIFPGVSPTTEYKTNRHNGSYDGNTYYYWQPNQSGVNGGNAANGLMHMISSNYDNKPGCIVGMASSWQDETTNVANTENRFVEHTYTVDGEDYTWYPKYYGADNPDDLNTIFSNLASQSGAKPLEMSAATVVQDQVSANFTLPEGTDASKIRVWAPLCTHAEFDDEGNVVNFQFADTLNTGTLNLNAEGVVVDGGSENRLPSSSVVKFVNYDEQGNLVVDDNGNPVYSTTATKYMRITGFNFKEMYCGLEGQQGHEQPRGRKLVIAIPLKAEEGVWGDGMETNGPLSFVLPDGSQVYYQFEGPVTNVMGDVWTEIVTQEPDGYRDDDIDSPEDLAWFISRVNGRIHYNHDNNIASNTTLNGKLTADIDMSAHNWVPIGSGYKVETYEYTDPETEETEIRTRYVFDNNGKMIKLAYEGVFDGNGHVITGLKNNADKWYKTASGQDNMVVVYPGMFSNVKGTVHDVFILDSDFRGKAHQVDGKGIFIHHGILADTLTGGQIYNCEAAGRMTCNNDNDNDVNLVYGGLVGLNNGGTIYNCMAMPKLTGYTMGGAVGENRSGSFRNGFTNGQYSYLGEDDTYKVGGIAGTNGNNGKIENCYVRFSRNNENLDVATFDMLVGSGSAAKDCYTPELHTYSHPEWNSENHLVDINLTVPDPETAVNPYTLPVNSTFYRMFSNDNMTGGAWCEYGTNTWIYTQNGQVSGKLATPLMEALNNGKEDGEASWKRTTAGNYDVAHSSGNINMDLPVLQLPGYTCLASTDGITIDYAHNLSDMLHRHNSGALNENTSLDSHPADENKNFYKPTDHPAINGGTINLFANEDMNPSNSNSGAKADLDASYYNTDANVVVYIDENISLLQPTDATTTPSSIEAYTGQTLKSFRKGEKGERWHFVSSSLEDSQFGITYGTSSHVPFNGIDENVNPCNMSLSQVNEDHSLFPIDLRNYRFMDFYCFFEEQYHWINFKRNSASHHHMDGNHELISYTNESSFVPGKGYLLSVDMETWASYNRDAQFLQNRGTLNNGNDISFKVTAKAPEWTGLKGYNLIGNPYQSYLDFEAFKTGNPDLWTSEDVFANTYAVYDPKSDSWLQYASTASQNEEVASQYINMHQGFMIRVSKDGAAKFTNAMRVNDPGENYPGFRGTVNYPLINFILDNGKDAKNVAVLELGRPENGGAEKLNVGSTKGRISLRHDNQDFGILFRDITEGSQPLYFDTDEDGTFTLSWNTANADFSSLTLVDNLTGVRYDMLANDSYSFEGKASDYRSRFKVIIGRFTDVEENEETVTDNFAFFDGSDWIVNGQGQLTVTDMTGRTVYSSNLTNDQNRVSLNGVANGIYLMRVANGQNVNVQKIIIK